MNCDAKIAPSEMAMGQSGQHGELHQCRLADADESVSAWAIQRYLSRREWGVPGDRPSFRVIQPGGSGGVYYVAVLVRDGAWPLEAMRAAAEAYRDGMRESIGTAPGKGMADLSADMAALRAGIDALGALFDRGLKVTLSR